MGEVGILMFIIVEVNNNLRYILSSEAVPSYVNTDSFRRNKMLHFNRNVPILRVRCLSLT